MGESNTRLRLVLLEIDHQLTERERQRLCFLIGTDVVPRRLLDAIAKDGSESMLDIWQILLDRRKITFNNVNYLVDLITQIERFDLVDKLKAYCPIPFSLETTPSSASNNSVEQRARTSGLFSRINP